MSKKDYEENRPDIQVIRLSVEKGFSASLNNDIEDATSYDYGIF